MSGSSRHTEAARCSAVSRTVALTAAVRMLAAAVSVPVALGAPDRAGALAAVGLGMVVAAAELAGRDVLAGSPRLAPAALAADLLAAATVLVLAGPGPVALSHSVGTAAFGAALLGPPGIVAGLGAGLTAAVLTAWFPAGPEPLSVPAAAGLPAPYVLVAVLVGVVRELLAGETDLRARLAAESDRTARAEERGRLSRDLHDSAAATLSGIRLTASGLHAVLAAPGPHERATALALAADVRDAADRALLEARVVVADLRVDDGADPLEDAVRRTATVWLGRSGGQPVTLSLDLHPVPEPPAEARAALLAALREALLNINRHAAAGRVTVGLRSGRVGPVLTVTDDGRGFAVPADLATLADHGHFGLAGTADRLASAGRLVVSSRPGTGTRVRVELAVRA